MELTCLLLPSTFSIRLLWCRSGFRPRMECSREDFRIAFGRRSSRSENEVTQHLTLFPSRDFGSGCKWNRTVNGRICFRSFWIVEFHVKRQSATALVAVVVVAAEGSTVSANGKLSLLSLKRIYREQPKNVTVTLNADQKIFQRDNLLTLWGWNKDFLKQRISNHYKWYKANQ